MGLLYFTLLQICDLVIYSYVDYKHCVTLTLLFLFLEVNGFNLSLDTVQRQRFVCLTSPPGSKRRDSVDRRHLSFHVIYIYYFLVLS
jgi:hypothetical protein